MSSTHGALARFFRRFANGGGTRAADAASPNQAPAVSILEPTWDGISHLPANIGYLRTLELAYPSARLHFTGGREQVGLLSATITDELRARTRFSTWQAYEDPDTMPGDVRIRIRQLLALPVDCTFDAERIVMASCTANTLTAITLLGLAGRTCAYLHGNANSIDDWTSRNPIRHFLQFGPAARRFVRAGGRLIVLEERIRRQLGEKHPWLAHATSAIPHPLVPEEAPEPGTRKPLAEPIEIGFAGVITVAKGFPDFLRLANALNAAQPGRFRFHAFGRLSAECKTMDQSALTTRPDKGLDRPTFVAGLKRQHFLFVWHNDDYYGNAASGILYDAINLGLPLIARDSAQIREWKAQGLDTGLAFDNIAEAIAAIGKLAPESNAPAYRSYQDALEKLRDSLGFDALARLFAAQFPLAGQMAPAPPLPVPAQTPVPDTGIVQGSIALVIPTYNRARLVGETIASALAQSVAFAEIIVVDDGSNDDTPEVLAPFGDAIRVIRTANQGVQAARNTGVAAATAEFVTMADSDDLFQPDYVLKAQECLAALPGTDLMFSNFVNFSDQGESPDKLSFAPPGFLNGTLRHGDFIHGVNDWYARMLDFQPLFPTGMMIRRSLYNALGGYDVRFRGVGAEDWEFTLRAVAAGQVAICQRALTRIRRHDGNDSADNLRMTLGEIRILEHGLRHHEAARALTPAIQQSIAKRQYVAFVAAYYHGNLDLALDLAKASDGWTHYPSTTLKIMICRTPAPLKGLLWRITRLISDLIGPVGSEQAASGPKGR